MAPCRHVNFASTFSWNQFWDLTIPVRLRLGRNTIRFTANEQYNYDGTTIGVSYSGSGIGPPLRSDTAPAPARSRWRRSSSVRSAVA